MRYLMFVRVFLSIVYVHCLRTKTCTIDLLLKISMSTFSQLLCPSRRPVPGGHQFDIYLRYQTKLKVTFPSSSELGVEAVV